MLDFLWPILKYLGIIAATFILFFLYKLYLKPYRLVQFYKKQNIHTQWYPFGSRDYVDLESITKHGDFFYEWKQLANKDKLPLFAANYGEEVTLVLFDTQLIKDFISKQDLFIKNPTYINVYRELTGNGLFTSEGKHWKRHRKFISSTFHYEFLSQAIPNVVKTTVEKLKELGQSANLDKVDIIEEMQQVTGEVVGRIFFGDQFGNYTIQGKKVTIFTSETIEKVGDVLYDPMYQLFGKGYTKLGLNKKYRDMYKNINLVKSFCESRVKEIIKGLEDESVSGKRKNLIQLLHEMRQADEEGFSDKDIVDEFITFLIAGMDTTAHLIAMGTYYYLKNPQTHAKIKAEVDQYFKDTDSVTMDTLNKMDYTTAFLKETLRLAPPGASSFERQAIKDHQIGKYNIKKGTVVCYAPVVSGSLEKFHDDISQFKPERWLEQSSKTMKTVQGDPFSHIPFGAGPRNCIGQYLAMNEARAVLALFVKLFDYELTDKNYDLKMAIRFTYEPAEKLMYKMKVK